MRVGPFCSLHSKLCTHKTPIVPRFFALSRETKFFHNAHVVIQSVNICAILSHFKYCLAQWRTLPHGLALAMSHLRLRRCALRPIPYTFGVQTVQTYEAF
jgi:hypothetical protein